MQLFTKQDRSRLLGALDTAIRPSAAAGAEAR